MSWPDSGSPTLPPVNGDPGSASVWWGGSAEGRSHLTRRGRMAIVLSALVVVLCCVPLFLGLDRTDLRGDEAIYSFGVVRMLETGDWLFPKSSPHEDAAFLEKPPLKFWIVAASIRFGLLPDNEFGLRFWDAVFGSLAFLYVFAIGRRMAGPGGGAVAVLVLVLQAPLLFVHGLRSNNMEGALLLAYCGGIYHYLRWTTADGAAARSRQVAAVAAYGFLGLMTKFVAVAFLPLVLLTTSAIVKPYRVRLLRDWRRWLVGFLGTLVLAAPWFVAAHLRFGREFWNIILGEHVYRRFTTYLDPAHVHPWYYYFAELYRNVDAASLSLIVLPGVVVLVARTIRERWPEGVLVLVWGIVPLGLMSLTTSKLWHYAYPFLPPMALAAGCLPGVLMTTVQPRFMDWVRSAERRVAEGRVPRFLAAMRRPAMRTVLLSAADAAVVLGVATVFYGSIRVTVGGVFLFRTSGLFRPWLVALLLALLAGRPTRIAGVAIPLLILGALPVASYSGIVARALVERHPLRSARDCIRQVQLAGPPSMPRGIYVDAPGNILLHEDNFYFRGVRPFERAEPPSDAGLYTALYRRGAQRPVLVSETRYHDLRTALQTGDPRLADALAEDSGATQAEILAHGSEPPPRALNLPLALLLLPGPYDVCGAGAVAPVGQR